MIKHFASYSFPIKEKGSVLEKGACYIVPMMANLSLASHLRGVFSPKSSTGREDILTRVLCDEYRSYDKTPYGYKGPLYLEITPLSFNVRITPGLDLIQMRVRDKFEPLSGKEISVLHSSFGIVRNKDGVSVSVSDLDMSEDGLYFHVDLERHFVGFEARENPAAEVYLNTNNNRWESFWRRVMSEECQNGELILTPGKFYLLSTLERMVIPDVACGELTVYDLQSGDFRSHYAGFFDRHFGFDIGGSHGVLEVRVRDVPFRICHGQRICKMIFERPDRISGVSYGVKMGSHYTSPHPCLAKHYSDFQTAWVE